MLSSYASTSLKESFSSVKVPVLSKQIVRTMPQRLIFSGLMQKTFFLFILFNEKEIPKERQVGRAGGTLIVTKSNSLMMISFYSISPRSYLSRNVLIEAIKEMKATKNKIMMNFPASFVKDS